MLSPSEIEKMDDKDIGIYASGGYGYTKQRMFLMSLRDTARKARLYDGKHPEPEPQKAA